MEEIDGLQKASPLQINVKLIHSEEQIPVCCDPATISEEACSELARQLNITSTFGWSLYAECKAEVRLQNLDDQLNGIHVGLFTGF